MVHVNWEKAPITMRTLPTSSKRPSTAYEEAGYNYTARVALARVEDALANGWANPGAQGSSWEGTFTIPVYDVGDSLEKDDQHTYRQTYDWRKDDICLGAKCQTKMFMQAANGMVW